MIAVGKTDVGKRRKQNQDSLFICKDSIGNLPNLYIVADGMGGHKSGEVASNLVIHAFCEYIKINKQVHIADEEDLFIFLKRGISYANHVIYEKSHTDESLMGMGTTLTLCTLSDDFVYVAHVGDTRLYSYEGNVLKQITTDHSVVQELLDRGCITEDELSEHPHRHMITRAVGTYDHIKVDVFKYPLENVEKLILCSDGLTTMLQDITIATVLAEGKDLKEILDKLVDSANEAGGYDNIAVIIIEQSEVKKEC